MSLGLAFPNSTLPLFSTLSPSLHSSPTWNLCWEKEWRERIFFKKIITERFPELLRDRNILIQETVMPSRISKNKSTYKHIVVSQQKTKRKILVIWGEKQINHKWETIKEEAFPMIMIAARRQWINIFKVLKEVMVSSEFWIQLSDHWSGRSALEHFWKKTGKVYPKHSYWKNDCKAYLIIV